MSPRGRAVASWGAVALVAAALVAWRYRTTVAGGVGIDLGFFLDAARRAREGTDLYQAQDYVYSPLVAWLLALGGATEQVLPWWTALMLVAALVSVTAVVATHWAELRRWQRPAVAAVAVTTLLVDHAVGLDLALGQTDLFVLATTALAVLLAVRRLPAASGAALAVGALVKTWPAAFALWALRAGAPRRVRTLAAAAAVGAAFVGLVALVAGPQTVVQYIRRTVEMSDQRFIVYSVWGPGHHLLTDSGNFVPLAQLPAAATALGWVLAAGVVALVVVVLRRPGDASLAMWNLVTAVTLLLPVSHEQYQLLTVPLVWVWTAHLLSDHRKRDATIATVAVGVRWLTPLVVYLIPVDSRWHYLALVAVTLVAFAASVLLAARRDVPLDRPGFSVP